MLSGGSTAFSFNERKIVENPNIKLHYQKKISVKSTAPLLYVQLPRSFLDPFFEYAGHKTWPRAKDRWLLRTGSLTVEGKTVSSHLENGRSSLAVSWPGSQANSPGPSADPLRQTNGPHRTFFANQSERS